MNRIKYILAAFAALACLPISAKDYYASAFGIKSNGTTLNTTSIQKAIDYISEEGGGKLIFKVGRYLTGSIELKDNVTIDLGEGAILVGSTNPYDYPQQKGFYGFISAHGAKNIALVGKGVIDGQGRELANNYLAQVCNGFINDPLQLGRPSDRPHLFYLRDCENVTVSGINVRSSACWTCTFDHCKNVLVDGISLESRAFWNNDGVDICDCENFTIRNSFVNSSDDGICLKSHDPNSKCKNVVIKNNVITSSASAIKFGTYGRGGFEDVQILDNTVYDTFRSAVAIEAVDGGNAENILVDGLKALNTANAIFMIVGDRVASGSYMKNVTIRNVYAEVVAAKPDRGYEYEGPTLEYEPRNVLPCSIVGLPGNNISNVTLENVEIKFPGGAMTEYAHVTTKELDNVPEQPKAYPEFSQFKELPAWGFYIRHADNIIFKNVLLSAAEKDYRPAIVLDDVQNSDFRGVKAVAPKLKGKVFSVRSKGIRK